jgi:cytochrome c-type biogenesis protein CcmH/NrfG
MQKALQLDPARSDSYLNLAMLQMRGQQWDAAEASFKKAVELNPKSANALLVARQFLPDSRPLSRGRADVPPGH